MEKQEQALSLNREKIKNLQTEALVLLKQLIAIPSFSKEEDKTASVIYSFLSVHGVQANRINNNIWATNKYYDENKPTILLNSHHDTVKPITSYTKDPFTAIEEKGKLFGLGSNDAGASLVSLIGTFLYFHELHDLKFNLVIAATGEEEISGKNGVESLLPNIPGITCAIVGEPTLMQMAIAERGLMVLDCLTTGRAGHAARNEGENAIYKAVKDIEWIQNYNFKNSSDLLGPVKMAVTSIETENKAHNVIPSECKFIVDIRVNELYSLEEVLQTIKNNVSSTIRPRSMRIRSSMIPLEHPLVKAGLTLGRNYYGSPTTSDKALISVPALKLGPGDSARSHTADEFIYIEEIHEGIEIYIQLLNQLL
ncbi:MAG: M20 family metallo-hydrolase [Candidatus Dadabacteria bacterium]